MRINRFIAQATGLSRRAADTAVAERRVTLNDQVATLGTTVDQGDTVRLDQRPLRLQTAQTIMLHKPTGYITSRRQQGATPTVYALLPAHLHRLKPVGRLDRDSSGLLLMTNDGALAQQLQHPRAGKWKHYNIRLDRPLTSTDRTHMLEGVNLDDGLSQLSLIGDGSQLTVKLQEGRNRQIRRSFAALGYQVIALHRTQFGDYSLGKLRVGAWTQVEPHA